MEGLGAREELLKNRKNIIKKRMLIQRDWREEFVHRMEIIDINKELLNIIILKKIYSR